MTEPGELAAQPPEPPPDEGEVVAYTSSDKLRSVLLGLNRMDRGNGAGGPLRAVHWALRSGMLAQFTGALPPLEDHEAWDNLLGTIAGVCLNLVSDGMEVQIPAARAAGAELLASVM